MAVEAGRGRHLMPTAARSAVRGAHSTRAEEVLVVPQLGPGALPVDAGGPRRACGVEEPDVLTANRHVSRKGRMDIGEWSWLARKDSNLQSPDPESGALPLGHAPAI
jgi:hypothetical protein